MTENNLHDQNIQEPLDRFVTEMKDDLNDHYVSQMKEQSSFTPRLDIFLDVGEDGSERDYYICDVDSRSIFWIDMYDVTSMADRVNGISSMKQLSELNHCIVAHRTKPVH